jgi:hypothetical protein
MKTIKHAIVETGVAAPALAQPVVMVTNHEPLMFRRRVGAGTDAVEAYEYEHSEAAVEALARRGVTWHRTHFYKGFGLRAEREEVERTRQFIQLCHRHGIKVEVYIQWGTLQYETLLAECPDMLDWCVETEEGHYAGICYSHQYFRYRPCTTREGVLEVPAQGDRRGPRDQGRRSGIRQRVGHDRAGVMPLSAMPGGVRRFPQTKVPRRYGGRTSASHGTLRVRHARPHFAAHL